MPGWPGIGTPAGSFEVSPYTFSTYRVVLFVAAVVVMMLFEPVTLIVPPPVAVKALPDEVAMVRFPPLKMMVAPALAVSVTAALVLVQHALPLLRQGAAEGLTLTI